MQSRILRSFSILFLSAFFLNACDIFNKAEVQIEDLVVGTGEVGSLYNSWQVQYTATILGQTTPFEQSTAEKPLTFVNDFSISPTGFSDGIQGMRVGGKRKITVPPSLAWGRDGIKDRNGKVIVPKNATIIFEVELLGQPSVTKTEITAGSGEEADQNDLLEVKYKGYFVDARGYFTDGTVFDQSTGDATFKFTLGVSNVIPGWHLGLVGARKGTKRTLIIPPHLGYGSYGVPNYQSGGYSIPPHATLGFEVEVVNITKG
ncbi:MAG TPA: FKBP-type peptidyl-prolyl cis-trans isomerase [Rhodothermales bacterium]|nr:FKBP-type peptidyl-prolyl cis-trans isomerase [Rhodothermales bacterium]